MNKKLKIAIIVILGLLLIGIISLFWLDLTKAEFCPGPNSNGDIFLLPCTVFELPIFSKFTLALISLLDVELIAVIIRSFRKQK